MAIAAGERKPITVTLIGEPAPLVESIFVFGGMTSGSPTLGPNSGSVPNWARHFSALSTSYTKSDTQPESTTYAHRAVLRASRHGIETCTKHPGLVCTTHSNIYFSYPPRFDRAVRIEWVEYVGLCGPRR